MTSSPLPNRSIKLASTLQDVSPASRRHPGPPSSRRVAVMCPNGVSHLVAQWACWMSGSAAVPLLTMGRQTEEQLEHCINDAGCDVVVATEAQVDRVRNLTILQYERN